MDTEKNSSRMGPKTIELLKRCRVLETLEMIWPKETVLDWSPLELDDHDSQGSNDRLVTIESQSPKTGLKQLVIWGNTQNALGAIKIFKETLESVTILWDHENNAHDISNHPSVDGIEVSFLMPKLKRLGISQLVLSAESLLYCPRLETLDLSRTTTTRGSPIYWPSPPEMVILPVTLRKLELQQIPAMEFNLSWLKPLVQLEKLYLDNEKFLVNQVKDCFVMDLSTGWWFPKLRKASLLGKVAIEIQGQILWLAPKLEHLALSLWYNRQEGPLDTDTFLYPPSELNFLNRLVFGQEQGGSRDRSVRMAITAPASSTSISTASFPFLKFFTVTAFRSPKFQTTEAFGDVFFGHRARVDLSSSIKIKEDDSVQGFVRDKDNRSLLFPNLEQLELIHHKPYGQLYPCILQAMRSLPKLEQINYREPSSARTSYESLAEWLIEVPGHGMYDPNYRNRPKAPLVTATREGLKDDGHENQENNNSRCVVKFDHPLHVRYQLNPNAVVKPKTTGMKRWRQIFSWRKNKK